MQRKESHESLNLRNKWFKVYDYIVVGGGTAGCVVAARLSEDRHINVLMIEAGGPQTVESDIPAFKQKLTGSSIDWIYPVKPQKRAYLGFIGNTRNLPRAKVFGGCSVHNSMNYYRESPEYWDYWTELVGVKAWNYSHVLYYFMKSENNLDETLVSKESKFHTTGGPLSVSTAKPDPILKEYLNLSPQLGYPLTYSDGRQPFGSTIMQRTIKDGVRQTSSLVFLENKKRRNLHILGQTLVTKILFNDKKCVIGVQFYRNKKYYEVFARKEVILSAGTVGSSKLLMLSGIGPKKHLESFKIPVLSDLNVGQFSYQMEIDFFYNIKNQSLIEKPVETEENYFRYFVENSGPLTYIASGVTCFRQVHYPGRSNLCNGLMLPRIGFMGTDLEEMVKHYKLKDEWREYYRPYLNKTYLNVIAMIRRPQKKGTICLMSSNPFEYPVIDPDYFDEQDLRDLTKALKLSIEFFTSPQMSRFIEIFKNPIPGCIPCHNNYFCEEYLRCVIKVNIEFLLISGGCRMGYDSNAVVDANMKVFGVSGLRVVDASIIPIHSEQSNAITFMIGEYGSDLIQKQYSNHHAN